jgi:hypothetical protein
VFKHPQVTHMFVDKSELEHNPTQIRYNNYRESSYDTVCVNVIELTTGSDYSGGTVTKSNYQAMLRDFPDLIEIFGGYCTYALGFVGEPSKELLDTLNGLENYALYDEEHLVELEHELMMEAWEDFGRKEFKNYWERSTDDEYVDDDQFLLDYTRFETGCIVSFDYAGMFNRMFKW